MEAWLPAMRRDYIALTLEHQAIVPVSGADVAQLQRAGRVVEQVPGKGVFTLKAPDAAKKARLVACGNYLGAATPQPDAPNRSPTLRKQAVYASGLDSHALRIQLAVASWFCWRFCTLDIKTAFLGTPIETVLDANKVIITIVEPPQGSWCVLGSFLLPSGGA
jgi:hypothetical protein